MLLVIFRSDEPATLSPYIFVQTRFISTRLSIGHSAKRASLGVSTAGAIPLRDRNARLHWPAAWHPDDSEPARAIGPNRCRPACRIGQHEQSCVVTVVNCCRQVARPIWSTRKPPIEMRNLLDSKYIFIFIYHIMW